MQTWKFRAHTYLHAVYWSFNQRICGNFLRYSPGQRAQWQPIATLIYVTFLCVVTQLQKSSTGLSFYTYSNMTAAKDLPIGDSGFLLCIWCFCGKISSGFSEKKKGTFSSTTFSSSLRLKKKTANALENNVLLKYILAFPMVKGPFTYYVTRFRPRPHLDSPSPM